MKCFILTCLLVSISFCVIDSVCMADPSPNDIRARLKRSAEWQLAHPSSIGTRSWVIAPLYDGLLRTAIATGDAHYLAAVMRFGRQSGWMPGDRVYHADDHAVCHVWLDIFLMDRTHKERLAPTRDRLDVVLANPVSEALTFDKRPTTPGVSVSDRWSWCDALYMAPPTLTRLYAATGNKAYLEFLDREYRYTYDQLYDPKEQLFFRDATFFNKKTPAGKKTFWSRGNGWVYGGLALMLEYLPADHPTRGFYETLFKEMTSAILVAQQPDGLWCPSLLDVEQIPLGETSGSGFFVFGIAWGINHGLLDRATHWPAMVRGWDGLTTRTKADGYVGFVQAVGSAPAPLGPDSRQDYGTGAFLLAGSEVLRALGGAAKTDSASLMTAAEAILAAEAKTPRAYARLVPERKDDLAWENDKVAFRVYGPALRAGAEDSGIDVWCKRVDYPILNKWYHMDHTAKISYHQDHGEGYDGYHVGDTRGCGGLGLWINGKLVTSDTYISGTIQWTTPDVAEFKTVYRYPVKVGNRPLYEHRLTRLRLGERLSEIVSFFSHDPRRHAKPITDFPHIIAIGLVTQNTGATLTLEPLVGYMAVYEAFDGTGLGTGLVINPSTVLRMGKLPANDKAKKNDHAVVFARPDKQGKVVYRAGFAWAADGEITTSEQWIHYLKQQAAQCP